MLSRASLMIPRRALAMSRPNLGPKKKKKKAGGGGKVVEVKLPDPETVKRFLTSKAKINFVSLFIFRISKNWSRIVAVSTLTAKKF